jgi:hypothetical protein
LEFPHGLTARYIIPEDSKDIKCTVYRSLNGRLEEVESRVIPTMGDLTDYLF